MSSKPRNSSSGVASNCRAWANRTGHALSQKIHEADCWVAATALALDLELVAGDRIFENVAGLAVLPVASRRA